VNDWVRFPAGAGISPHPDRFWDPLSLLPNRYRDVLSSGVKRLGREGDYSPPSSGPIPPLPYTSSWRGDLYSNRYTFVEWYVKLRKSLLVILDHTLAK
jgi:hypothetical protein